MRILPSLLVLGLLPSALHGQASPDLRSAVDSLLLHTEAPSFVAAVEDAFGQHFVRLSTNLSTLQEVDAAASEAFADSLVYRDIAEFLASEADPAVLRTVLGWLGSGAAAEIRTITDSTELGQSFDDFLESLRESPPDPARLELVDRWARARRAGEFVLLLDEAQREAAHTVASALDPGAPPFEPISDDEFGRAYSQTRAYAVASFLHRFQPVPDDVLEAATKEYESESGQWFVEAYSLALAHAVREASHRLVEAMGRSVP